MIFPKQCILAAFALFTVSSAVHADTLKTDTLKTDAPKSSFAVFFQKDPAFSETVTLYSDGKYQQSETQLNASFYHCYSYNNPGPNLPLPDFGQKTKRVGIWQLLDKEGGLPLLLKPGAGIPLTAVIALKDAMPFGFVWDNQLPYHLHTTRILRASDFQFAAKK